MGDKTDYVKGLMMLGMEAAKKAVDEVGALEYGWIVLEAFGMPKEEIPNDPGEVVRALKIVLSAMLRREIDPSVAWSKLTLALHERGSPEVQGLLESQVALYALFRKHLEE